MRKFLGKLARGVGKVAKTVAPALPFVFPGIGALGAAAIGGIGALVDGDGLGGAAKSAAAGAIAGAAGGAAKGAAKGGILGRIGKFLGGGDGFDLGDIGRIAGAALPAIEGVRGFRQAGQDSAMSRQLLEQAMAQRAEATALARSEFDAGAPMRDAFRGGAMNFFDPTNPFGVNMAGGMASAAIPPQPQAQRQAQPAPQAMPIPPNSGGVAIQGRGFTQEQL